jgi:hypothetical protein
LRINSYQLDGLDFYSDYKQRGCIFGRTHNYNTYRSTCND